MKSKDHADKWDCGHWLRRKGNAFLTTLFVPSSLCSIFGVIWFTYLCLKRQHYLVWVCNCKYNMLLRACCCIIGTRNCPDLADCAGKAVQKSRGKVPGSTEWKATSQGPLTRKAAWYKSEHLHEPAQNTNQRWDVLFPTMCHLPTIWFCFLFFKAKGWGNSPMDSFFFSWSH